MKKFFALLLALCMIMSCMTIVVSAEGTEEVEATKIRLEAFTDFINGGTAVENPDPELVQLYSYTKDGYQVGGIQFSWTGKTDDDALSIDVTDTEKFVMDLYISNAALLAGHKFDLEITSTGVPDQEENCISTAVLESYAEGGAFKDGWNTITIPMSEWQGGSCNLEAVNWVRMFTRTDMTGSPVMVPEGEFLEMKIRDAAFVKADGTEKVIPIDHSGWSWQYADWAGTRNFELPSEGGPGNFLTQTNVLETPLDLSTMKYVDLYMKVNGADVVDEIKFEIELCAGGGCDQQEMAYVGYFTTVGNGWTTVRVPLSAFAPSGTAPMGNDLTAINFIRWYAQAYSLDEGEATIDFAYMEFSDAATTNYEEYTITPGELEVGASTEPRHNPPNGDGKTGYFTFVSGASQNDGCQFADKESEIVYKFNLNYIRPSYVYLVAGFSGDDALVQVGIKNEEDSYIDVYGSADPEAEDVEVLPGSGTYLIDLNSFIATGAYASAGYQFYLRIADSDTSDGNGGQILRQPLRVIVGYSEDDVDPEEIIITEAMMEADLLEMTRTEHSIPFFGCNVAIGTWEVDMKNFQAGASSLSYTLGEWVETDKDGKEVTVTHNGQSSFANKFETFCGEEFIDCTGMDTFEFDMYISDVEALQSLTFGDTGLELTSAGTHDQEETSWKLPDLIAACEGGAKNGWNKVRLSIDFGSCDFTRVNYMRFFFVNCSNTPVVNSEAEGITIKIDNLRFTDYKAQQMEAEKPVANEMAQKIYDALKDLPLEFDKNDQAVIDQFAANYDAWVALKDGLKEELGALSDIAQELVGDIVIEGAEDDSAKLLSSFQSALNKYKRYKEDLENNPPEDTPGTDTPGTDTPGTDTPGTDTPGTDTPGTDTPGTDTPGTTDPEKSNTTTIIIIVVVAVVVVAAGVVAFIVIKKKKA